MRLSIGSVPMSGSRRHLNTAPLMPYASRRGRGAVVDRVSRLVLRRRPNVLVGRPASARASRGARRFAHATTSRRSHDRPRPSSATGAGKPTSSASWWARCLLTPRSSAISTIRTVEERFPSFTASDVAPIGTDPEGAAAASTAGGRGRAACRPGPCRWSPRIPPGRGPAGRHRRRARAAPTAGLCPSRPAGPLATTLQDGHYAGRATQAGDGCSRSTHIDQISGTTSSSWSEVVRWCSPAWSSLPCR